MRNRAERWTKNNTKAPKVACKHSRMYEYLKFCVKKNTSSIRSRRQRCLPDTWRGILLTFLKQNINSTNSNGSSSYSLHGARTHARDCGHYTCCFTNHVLADISRFFRNSENMKQENEWCSSRRRAGTVSDTAVHIPNIVVPMINPEQVITGNIYPEYWDRMRTTDLHVGSKWSSVHSLGCNITFSF